MICKGSLWCFPFLVLIFVRIGNGEFLIDGPNHSIQILGGCGCRTWIWLSKFTRFCWCLYEAMSKPYKDMLACVFYSCLRTSSSSASVCWVDLSRASTGLSISKYGGLKCLPPCDMGNFGWIIGINVLGFEVSPPICGYQVT